MNLLLVSFDSSFFYFLILQHRVGLSCGDCTATQRRKAWILWWNETTSVVTIIKLLNLFLIPVKRLLINHIILVLVLLLTCFGWGACWQAALAFSWDIQIWPVWSIASYNFTSSFCMFYHAALITADSMVTSILFRQRHFAVHAPEWCLLVRWISFWWKIFAASVAILMQRLANISSSAQ